MMRISRLEKEEINVTAIKDIRNLFRLKKETEAIWNRILRDIRNLFEHEEGDYYKPVRVGNLGSNNRVLCESNTDRNQTLSVYRNKLRIP